MAEEQKKKSDGSQVMKAIKDTIEQLVPKCSTINDPTQKEKCEEEMIKELEKFVDDIAVELDPAFGFLDTHKKPVVPEKPQ